MRPKQMITDKMINTRNKLLVFVSNLTGVPADDIMSTKRHEQISTARQLVMWAMFEIYCFTQTQVGILMQRDHSTVTYAIAHINGGHMGADVEHLKNKIRKEARNENIKPDTQG